MKAYPSTDKCQLCECDLRKFDTFYDGKTSIGPWAWMCKRCYQLNGRGLGTGLGQEYCSKTNEKLR